MALLLAKRASKELKAGEWIEILISDQSSARDIKAYLTTHGYALQNTYIGNSYRIRAIKETS